MSQAAYTDQFPQVTTEQLGALTAMLEVAYSRWDFQPGEFMSSDELAAAMVFANTSVPRSYGATLEQRRSHTAYVLFGAFRRRHPRIAAASRFRVGLPPGREYGQGYEDSLWIERT